MAGQLTVANARNCTQSGPEIQVISSSTFPTRVSSCIFSRSSPQLIPSSISCRAPVPCNETLELRSSSFSASILRKEAIRRPVMNGRPEKKSGLRKGFGGTRNSKPEGIKIMASLEKTEEPDVSKKTEEYSGNMQQAMGTGLTYRHELGMNYAHVLPDLIVGSCLQTPADVDRLRDVGVRTIFCLQQDPDLAYFSVDIGAIQSRAADLDGIEHIRAQIRDFDPYDLRLRLPKVLAILYKATKKNGGITYVHCTAGLGRAPAVALTYMYWIRGYDLFEANAMLQSVRHCHPKLDSIKAATADLLAGNPSKKVLLSWKRGASQSVEVSGLDVGWYERLAFHQGDDGHWYLERDVPVGRYEFKFIVDGNWTNNPDISETQPNKDGHVNNYIEVKGGPEDAETWKLRKEIMADDFVLTEEHRKVIREKLEALAED